MEKGSKGGKASQNGNGKPAASGDKKQQKAAGGKAEKIIRAVPTSQKAPTTALPPSPQYVLTIHLQLSWTSAPGRGKREGLDYQSFEGQATLSETRTED